MSTDFNKRIDGYHTSLPGGLYVNALLTNPSLKRFNGPWSPYYVMIEKEIFVDIVAQGGEPVQSYTRRFNAGETEWIFCSEAMIESAFKRADHKYAGKHTELFIQENLKGDLDSFLPQLERDVTFKGEIYL